MAPRAAVGPDVELLIEMHGHNNGVDRLTGGRRMEGKKQGAGRWALGHTR